jgi:hypothetical protein
MGVEKNMVKQEQCSAPHLFSSSHKSHKWPFVTAHIAPPYCYMLAEQSEASKQKSEWSPMGGEQKKLSTNSTYQPVTRNQTNSPDSRRNTRACHTYRHLSAKEEKKEDLFLDFLGPGNYFEFPNFTELCVNFAEPKKAQNTTRLRHVVSFTNTSCVAWATWIGGIDGPRLVWSNFELKIINLLGSVYFKSSVRPPAPLHMMGFIAIENTGATGRDPCTLGHPQTKHRLLFIAVVVIIIVKPRTQNMENTYNTRPKTRDRYCHFNIIN